MLIFLDTEYTDPIQIDLISIGIVSEDGSVEFYAERSDYRTDDCNAFVNSVVLPLLDAPPDSVMRRVGLAIRLGARGLRTLPLLDDQELSTSRPTPLTYWEGLVKLEGSFNGRGYLEMTGYAGHLQL